VDWVQVRDHQASARELFELTEKVIAACRPRGVRVAVNDRLDVALAAGADGVQLGERSLTIAAVRKVAPRILVGASVHDLASAVRAAAEGANWLTFGHIFPTSSHPGEPPRGLDILRQVVRASGCPVIAIGGITEPEILDVLATGAAGVAVISAILGAARPGAAAAALRRALG
jgi:thiamine-phosphate pyrophosphorylase